MHSVCVRFRLPASLRMAWDIMRACRPTVWSPIWPSSSARGVRAATDAQREIEREGARGDRVDLDLRALVAHPHDGSLAELALDLGQRSLKGGVAGLGGLLLVGDGHAHKPFCRTENPGSYGRNRT